MQRRDVVLAVVLGVALTPVQAQEGDAQAAREKVSMCIGCHGIPGYRTAFPDVYPVPKLGGQHAAYLVKALRAYRDGGRKHAGMQAIAQSLSEQDMADLAAYYADAAAAPAASLAAASAGGAQ